MTAKEIQFLHARIKEETNNMQNLLMELETKGLLKSRDNEKLTLSDDSFTLRAVGSILHDFYVAVENVFEMISREIDESTPQGLDWHIQLLRQMSLDVPKVRPAVIKKRTLYALDQYRAFRHVFRNVYGFSLDSNRIKSLLEAMPAAVLFFTEDMDGFMSKMEAIS